MEDELLIENIDTTRQIPLKLDALRSAIVDLQVKVNEIIDVINEEFAPDDAFDDDDEEEEDDGEEKVLIQPSDLKLGKRKPQKMN